MPKRIGTHLLVMEELADTHWTHHVEAKRGHYSIDMGGFGDVIAWNKTGPDGGPFVIQTCTYGHLEEHLQTCADRVVYPQLHAWLDVGQFEIWCWFPKKQGKERDYIVYVARQERNSIRFRLRENPRLQAIRNITRTYTIKKGQVTG